MVFPLTLVTTCKPFVGETGMHQQLAIQSWRKLGLEVFLIGNDSGTAEISIEYGCTHIPNVSCSIRGIPLLDSLISVAHLHSRTEFIAYINADIVLSEDFLDAALLFFKHYTKGQNCLLTSRRKNIPIIDLSPESDDIEICFRDLEERFGTWDLSDAIDIFLFNRELFDEVLPFEVGRMQWDNWLLAEAQRKGADIVDGSLSFALLHPIHGYDVGWQEVIGGEATQNNRELANGVGADINSVRTHALVDGEIKKLTQSLVLQVDMCVQENPRKELLACLYTIEMSDLKADGKHVNELIRRFLWRRHIYFPVNAEAPDFSDLMGNVNGLIAEAEQGHYVPLVNYLQDMICTGLLERLRVEQASGREIALWGTGNFANGAISFLQRHNISISFLLETRQTTERYMDYVVFNPETIPSKKMRPFIIIASMFVAEISASLEDLGYRNANDYTH